jgi:hypothetical protein
MTTSNTDDIESNASAHLAFVRLPGALLPYGLRNDDGTPLQFWPAMVYPNPDSFVESLASRTPTPRGVPESQCLWEHAREEIEENPNLCTARLLHFDPGYAFALCSICGESEDYTCHRCSEVDHSTYFQLGYSSAYYVRLSDHTKDDIQDFDENKDNLKRLLNGMITKHKQSSNDATESNGYCIHGHATQFQHAMNQIEHNLNPVVTNSHHGHGDNGVLNRDYSAGTNLQAEFDSPEPSAQKKRRRKRERDFSLKKIKKHGSDNGNEAEAAGGTVADVSLCGDDCSTPSQPKLSSQSDMGRRREIESFEEEGGSRIVLNKTSPIISGPNTRTCLLDAVMALLSSNVNREKIRDTIIALMPPTGDTQMLVARTALSQFGLGIESATSAYDNKKGGIAHQLLQERQCKLILRIKLITKSNRETSHFVAWDGKMIHDRPMSSVVSDINDRKTKERSREVFSKLYRKFKDWRITRVYSIVEEQP